MCENISQIRYKYPLKDILKLGSTKEINEIYYLLTGLT